VPRPVLGKGKKHKGGRSALETQASAEDQPKKKIQSIENEEGNIYVKRVQKQSKGKGDDSKKYYVNPLGEKKRGPAMIWPREEN